VINYLVYKLQSHAVNELKVKFGDTDSTGRRKQFVHNHFDSMSTKRAWADEE